MNTNSLYGQVRHILLEAGRPMMTEEIREILLDRGFTLKNKQTIHGVLGCLKLKSHVYTVDHPTIGWRKLYVAQKQ